MFCQNYFLLTSLEQKQTEKDKVWGAAYHIPSANVKEVRDYLDIREINGYSIQHTLFYAAEATIGTITCLVYIGMPDNPQFLGALEPADIAARINQCRGPSGENREYLLQLQQSLETLSIESEDEHVRDLARRVKLLTPPRRSMGLPVTDHASITRPATKADHL